MNTRVGNKLSLHAGEPAATMSWRKPAILAGLVVLGATILLCRTRAFAEPDQSLVHFRSPRDFSVVVPVYLEEEGPYEFLFDTGSTATVVDVGLSESLNLKRLGDASITTVSGRSSASLAAVHTIRVGPVKESNVTVIVRDLKGLRELDAGIRGVLGQNILKNVDYLLDHRNRVIQFDSSGSLLESMSGERVSTIVGALPENPAFSYTVVRVTLAQSFARQYNLILDSGSASVVLFSDLSSFFSAPRTSPSSIEDDAGQRRYVPQYHIQLRIGSTSRFIEAQLSAISLKSASIDGLLPTSMFQSVYISNSGSFVIFQPKRKHRHGPIGRIANLDKRTVMPCG